MQVKSSLSLEKYIVKTMNFSINENFQFDNNTTVRVSPEFQKKIKRIDENNAIANLIFRISNENLNLPFSIEVDIEGLFNMENWETPDLLPIMTTNSIAILFPYLRSIVSMITANANISPYVIPVMNINALFNEDNNSNE